MNIGISGPRGAGKDLLAKYLAQFGYQNLQLAGPLKEMCRRDFGFTIEQTDGHFKESPTGLRRTDGSFYTPRDIMIRVGTLYRSIDKDFWVKKLFAQMIPGCNYTISDVRFVNECEQIKAKGGILVRIERDPALNIYKAALDDLSETELNAYEGFDFRLEAYLNRVPADLEKLAEYIVENLPGALNPDSSYPDTSHCAPSDSY